MFGLGSPSGSSLPPGAATPRSSVGGGANEGADDLNKDPGQVSAMPLPPSNYIKLYTDENVARRVCPLPPPPINESYTMFGHPFSAEDSIIQSLESQVKITRRSYQIACLNTLFSNIFPSRLFLSFLFL